MRSVLVLVTLLAACSSLLDLKDPDVINPPDVANADGAVAAYNGGIDFSSPNESLALLRLLLPRAPEIRTASSNNSAVSPPDSIHGARQERPAISAQSKARPLPPGRGSGRRGGFASNSKTSATSS